MAPLPPIDFLKAEKAAKGKQHMEKQLVGDARGLGNLNKYVFQVVLNLFNFFTRILHGEWASIEDSEGLLLRIGRNRKGVGEL